MASNKFNIKPIPNKPMILSKFLSLNGLFLDKDNGTATPIINTNDGKTRSANVNPFHYGCYIHHGPSIKSSTTNIPITVRPLSTSNDINLCFFSGYWTAGDYLITSTVDNWVSVTKG